MSLSTARQIRRWFARPLFAAGVALAALIAVTAFVGLRFFQERQATSVSLEHSRQVLETLDRMRANLTDLEAERRAYLLTLDPAYLKPYGVTDESVRREAETLQTLVAADPLQSLRASHLALTISARLRELDDIVRTARASGLDAALTIIGSAMREIRSQVDQMVDHERFLMVDRADRAEALERSETWLIAAAVVVTTVFAGTALTFARLERKRRQKAIDENIRLQIDLQERESKIRRLFESDIIGIAIFDLEDWRFVDANDAFLAMVGYTREDLACGRLLWADMTPAEWRAVSVERLAELKARGTCRVFEKEYFRKDGSRVPVLVGSTALSENRKEAIAFMLDLTERKRAEAALRESEQRYREAMMELSHANRVMTVGQLTASIAHEVNQPIAAAVTNAEAGLRWLNRLPPNISEARQALERVVKDGSRAGEVIRRIRTLMKKAPAGKESLDINETILDIVALTQGEFIKHGVHVSRQLAPDLPRVAGDRVQLQQVIMNLIVNAVEAMSGVDEGARELCISTETDPSQCVLVGVCDSGPGLGQADSEDLFRAFYTTKANGMGMGLSICRSIIEAHGGRVWATQSVPRGATFYFTLPLQDAQADSASIADLGADGLP
jgi:PAS domain S-box-containing protein